MSRKTLCVLSVAYPLATVSENSVGGAEQVLAMLDRALVAAGHRSLVIAAEGSIVQGSLIPLPAISATIDDHARERAQQATRGAIAATLASEQIDLVHLHGVDFFEYLPEQQVPVLVTLHLPLAWYPADALSPTRPRTFLHCVSASQAASAARPLDFLEPIPNGVDSARYRLKTEKRNYALMLGRICPEKGVHLAIEASKRASIALLIGGQVYPYPAHEVYFRDEVAPRLDRCRRFLGPLDFARKAALLASASCLLIPSLAAETSSLVAMEALASGTPVIAFPAGALPEIVESGKTGYLVDDADEMSTAIQQANRISAAKCREQACVRFDQAVTIERYFAVYRQLVGG